MAGTIEVPKGLDDFTVDEAKLIERMRVEDAGDPQDVQPAPVVRETKPKPEAKTPEPAPVVDEPEDDEIDLETGERQQSGSKTVPHAQFHSANERRKAAEAALAAEKQTAAAEKARIQERLDLLAAAVQAPTAPPAPVQEDPLPDVNVDPVGHFKAAYERTQKQVQALTGIVQGSQEQSQRQAEAQALQNWGAMQEREFAAKEPAYTQAMDHLRQSRAKELTILGITDPREQQRVLAQDIEAIAIRTRQNGENFAEKLYQLAQERGFQKPAAAPAVAEIPPIEVPPIAMRQQAGRENSMTIGSAGTAPPTKLSVDKIANMSEKEFAVLMRRMEGNPAALRSLMGD